MRLSCPRDRREKGDDEINKKAMCGILFRSEHLGKGTPRCIDMNPPCRPAYLISTPSSLPLARLFFRTPYVITQFIYVCHSGQYVLLLFLLVELSTLPLNAMAFLEDLGLRRTRAHV